MRSPSPADFRLAFMFTRTVFSDGESYQFLKLAWGFEAPEVSNFSKDASDSDETNPFDFKFFHLWDLPAQAFHNLHDTLILLQF